MNSFDVILLPTFETSEMVERSRRRIRSKTVRNLLNLAHYKFKLFIKNKAAETGAVVLDVDEAYTSKTVSWTGECWRILAAHPWSSLRTASGWTVTTMERVGYTCARWEISPL